VKRDAIWTILALAFGLFAVPALVHLVGERTLGPYSDGGRLAFLADFYGDLVTLEPATLFIALGPAAVVLAWRLLRRLAGLG
jgi:hypothetical protein